MFFKKKKETIKVFDVLSEYGFSIYDCERLDINKTPQEVNPVFKNFESDTFISSYKQVDINAGILLGMPSDLSPYFEYSMKEAKKFFDGECIFIKPTITIDSEREGSLLPAIFTMATFDKFDKECETCRIAWWQHIYGLPSKEIVEQLKTVVWREPFSWTWSD